MPIPIVILCVILLILLISWGKINPFLAFLIISIVAGMLLGIPISEISIAMETGIGSMLGLLAGFWMFKEYFNLSLMDTFKSWTLMETTVGVAGIGMILLLDFLLQMTA